MTAAGPQAEHISQGAGRRLAYGMASSFAGQTVQALQSVALVPLFLNAWGADDYGRWLTLTALVAQLTLMDLGGQGFLANILAMSYARKDHEDFSARFSEGVSLFLALGILGALILTALVATFLTVPVPFLHRGLIPWEGAVLLLLGCHFLLFAIPGGVYATVYRATGAYARGAMIGNIFRLGGTVLVATLLATGASPVWIAAATAISGLALTIYAVADSRRIPEARLLRLSVRLAWRGRRMLSGSLTFWLISTSRAVAQQGVLLLLGTMATPATVAAYSVHRTLSTVPGYIWVVVQGPVLPEVSFLWANGRRDELRDFLFTLSRAVLLAAGAVSVAAWVFAPAVFATWVRHEVDLDGVLLALLLGQGIIASGWAVASWSLLATNRHRPIALGGVAAATITLGISAGLAASQGARGAAIAALAAEIAVTAIALPLFAARMLTCPVAAIHGHLMRAAAGVAVLSALAWAAMSVLDGWAAAWAWTGMAAAAAYPVTMLSLGKSDTTRVLGLLRKLGSHERGQGAAVPS